MKYCAYCGSQIGDTDKFCDHCGKPASVPQQPYGYTPVQARQYPPHYTGTPAQVFRPPVWIVGLFNFLGAIVTLVLSMIANSVLAGMRIKLAYFGSLVISGGYSVLYVLITGVGFVIYNNKCTQSGRSELRVSILWVAVIWLIREAISFVFGFGWGLLYSMLIYNISMVTVGVVAFIWNCTTTVITALLTWLLGSLILKAVLKRK